MYRLIDIVNHALRNCVGSSDCVHSIARKDTYIFERADVPNEAQETQQNCVIGIATWGSASIRAISLSSST